MIWMLRNSKGNKDAMLTFAVVAMLTVVAKVLIGGVSIELFGKPTSLGTIDAGTIGALLTPTLGAYCLRRHSEAQAQVDPSKKE